MARKNKSFEDRVSSADIKAKNALDVFEQAAADLEAAADAAYAVVVDAEAEVVRVTAARDTAFARFAAHNSAATKIRELVNG